MFDNVVLQEVLQDRQGQGHILVYATQGRRVVSIVFVVGVAVLAAGAEDS